MFRGVLSAGDPAVLRIFFTRIRLMTIQQYNATESWFHMLKIKPKPLLTSHGQNATVAFYRSTLSVCPTNSCTVSKRRKIEGQGFEAIMKCGNRSTCQDEYITCSVPQGGRKGNVLRRIAMCAHLPVRKCLSVSKIAGKRLNRFTSNFWPHCIADDPVTFRAKLDEEQRFGERRSQIRMECALVFGV